MCKVSTLPLQPTKRTLILSGQYRLMPDGWCNINTLFCILIHCYTEYQIAICQWTTAPFELLKQHLQKSFFIIIGLSSPSVFIALAHQLFQSSIVSSYNSHHYDGQHRPCNVLKQATYKSLLVPLLIVMLLCFCWSREAVKASRWIKKTCCSRRTTGRNKSTAAGGE